MSKKLFPELPILIVDNNENFLDSIDFKLRQEKITNIELCCGGHDVMKKLREKKYSVLLLDIIMPGVSGTELLPKIVVEFPEIPIIMLTGIDRPEVAFGCGKQGAYNYVVKGGDIKNLVSLIKEGLKHKPIEYKTTINVNSKPPKKFPSIKERKFLADLFTDRDLTIQLERIGKGIIKKEIDLRGTDKLLLCYLAYKNYKALNNKNRYHNWQDIPRDYRYRLSTVTEYNSPQEPEWEIFVEYTKKNFVHPDSTNIRQWKFQLTKKLRSYGMGDIIDSTKVKGGHGKGYLLKGRVIFCTPSKSSKQ